MTRLTRNAALVAALISAAPLPAQMVAGRVRDSVTGQPVAAVEVSAAVEGSTRATAGTRTDGTGWFSLRLRPGAQYRLTAHRLGYGDAASAPISLGAADTVIVELELRPTSVRLDEVVVTGRATPPFRDPRARDFFRRMEHGWGRFVTPEEVAARRPTTTMTLLRGVPTLRVGSSRQGIPQMQGRMRPHGAPVLCVPTIYVNGIRRTVYTHLDDVVDPDQLWGIEVYATPEEAPGELPPINPNCGVVAIWTREA